MASGNTLLHLFPGMESPPATTAAELTSIAGASTPAESILVLSFISASVTFTDFYCIMPRHYGGGGITATLITSVSATAGGTSGYVFSVAFRRVQDDAEDLDTTAQTYDYNNSSEIDPASAKGEVSYDAITFTDGADMDSVAAGELFILRVKRLTTDSNDDLGDDVYLHGIELKET